MTLSKSVSSRCPSSRKIAGAFVRLDTSKGQPEGREPHRYTTTRGIVLIDGAFFMHFALQSLRVYKDWMQPALFIRSDWLSFSAVLINSAEGGLSTYPATVDYRAFSSPITSRMCSRTRERSCSLASYSYNRRA